MVCSTSGMKLGGGLRLSSSSTCNALGNMMMSGRDLFSVMCGRAEVTIH